MSVEVVVALISAGVAVCSAAVSAYATARSIRLQHALTLKAGAAGPAGGQRGPGPPLP